MKAKFSLKEAAAIADVSTSLVRKSIEMKAIQPERHVVGQSGRYRFAVRDLLFLKVLSEFPLPLGKTDKRALYEIIERKRPSYGRWRQSNSALYICSKELELKIEISLLKESLIHRLRAFLRGRRRIVSNPEILGGEPVFEGTRIPLSHIAGLFADRVPIEEIREDYPALSSSDLEYATMVGRMKPNPGRPSRPLVLMRDGRPVSTVDRAVRVGEVPSR